MANTTINGADVHTPADAATAMAAVATTYQSLLKSIQQTRDNQVAHGVTGAPLVFLTQMTDAAVILSRTANASAAEFRRQVQKMNDTIGANPSLPGTQRGRYLDPSRQ